MASTGIQIPSLCIPRVYYKFDKTYIENVFVSIFGLVQDENDVDVSCIKKIDLVERTDRNTGEPFNIVFLHFHDGVEATPDNVEFVKKIEAGEEVKMTYSYPWFWKLRKNHATRREPRTFNGPRIIMNAEDEQEVMKHQKEYRESKALQTPPFYPGPHPPSTPPPSQEETEVELPTDENAEQA
jgi:hypothetical protein